MKHASVRLGDIAEINPPLPISPLDDDVVSFLPMSAIGEDATITSTDLRPFKLISNGYTQFIDNDVLLAKITPCMENGKAALVTGLAGGIGCGSTEFHVLRPKNDICPRYLFHAIWNPKFRSEASNNMTGSAGQKRVPKSFVKRYEIPLPSLDRQNEIAQLLDRAHGICGKHKESLRLLNAFLRSLFIDYFGDPKTNPKKWKVGTIRDLVSKVNYGTSEKADPEKGRFPVLRMNNITYDGGWDFSSLKFTDFPTEDEDKYLVKKGQMLFNRTNSRELVGKTAVYREEQPMAFAGYLVRAIPNADADIEYISAYLNSAHGKAVLLAMCKSIIGMANINAQEMLSIPVLLPPAKLQKQFGDIVRAATDKFVNKSQALREADTLFRSLQYRAFDGEL